MASDLVLDNNIVSVRARRSITMIPSLIVIGLGLDPLKRLVLSQVLLSFKLPFAMISLIKFTRDRKIMASMSTAAWSTGWLTSSLRSSCASMVGW